MPDLSALFSGLGDFVSAYRFFSVAAGAILVVLILTTAQSVAAHWRSRSVQIPEDFAKDEKWKEARERFWQHAMHEDGQYNDRLNFFLIFESILLGIVAALYVRSGSTVDPSLYVVATLGLVITLLWLNVQAYHKFYLDVFEPDSVQ